MTATEHFHDEGSRVKPTDITIITGPAECGKTRHAEAFATLMRAGAVFDGWDGVTPISGLFTPSALPVQLNGVLLLTNCPEPAPIGRIVSFDEAVAALKVAGITA